MNLKNKLYIYGVIYLLSIAGLAGYFGSNEVVRRLDEIRKDYHTMKLEEINSIVTLDSLSYELHKQILREEALKRPIKEFNNLLK